MATLWGFFMKLLALSSVLCEQMDWGENPDLVEESNPIQGREHIKRMVLLVGDNIDLECQVDFTTQNVSEIIWKIDRKLVNNNAITYPIVEKKNGEVFIEEHWKMNNISEDMDGSTVSCHYAKGQYTDSRKAILQVFKLEIETSEEVFKTGQGSVKLVFKESKQPSPGEANLAKRIKEKIAKMINPEITEDKSEYSATLPISNIKDNQAILAMKPRIIKDGISVTDTLEQCCRPEPEESDLTSKLS